MIDFISYLKNLKPGDWGKTASEKWTVKDVVAHLVGWEKEDARIIGPTWENKERPWFYKNDDYDDFNKKAVEFYKNYTPGQLIEEWKKWQKKVEQEIESIGKEKLQSCPDLFSWLFESDDDSHYSHHYRQIKNAVE